MDREAWWAIFNRSAKSRTQLKQLKAQYNMSFGDGLHRNKDECYYLPFMTTVC